MTKQLKAAFEYAVKTTNSMSVIANLDNPVHGDELRAMFREMTGATVSDDYDIMVAEIMSWARTNPDYDEWQGRSRLVVAL